MTPRTAEQPIKIHKPAAATDAAPRYSVAGT
jgi:hypothetical protein